MQKRNWLCLFALAPLAFSAACVTIPNTETCTAAGVLSAGAVCAETLTGKTRDMTVDEYISFLEPQTGGPNGPGRAGAICQSTNDWNKMKTALEIACRDLGRRCSYEIRKEITK